LLPAPAGQADTFTAASTVYWIVDLPDGPEDLTDAFGEHLGTWTVAYTIDGIRDWIMRPAA
jgi:hypothetical protein